MGQFLTAYKPNITVMRFERPALIPSLALSAMEESGGMTIPNGFKLEKASADISLYAIKKRHMTTLTAHWVIRIFMGEMSPNTA